VKDIYLRKNNYGVAALSLDQDRGEHQECSLKELVADQRDDFARLLHKEELRLQIKTLLPFLTKQEKVVFEGMLRRQGTNMYQDIRTLAADKYGMKMTIKGVDNAIARVRNKIEAMDKPHAPPKKAVAVSVNNGWWSGVVGYRMTRNGSISNSYYSFTRVADDPTGDVARSLALKLKAKWEAMKAQGVVYWPKSMANNKYARGEIDENGNKIIS
jgi:hypothetical protein